MFAIVGQKSHKPKTKWNFVAIRVNWKSAHKEQISLDSVDPHTHTWAREQYKWNLINAHVSLIVCVVVFAVCLLTFFTSFFYYTFPSSGWLLLLLMFYYHLKPFFSVVFILIHEMKRKRNIMFYMLLYLHPFISFHRLTMIWTCTLYTHADTHTVVSHEIDVLITEAFGVCVIVWMCAWLRRFICLVCLWTIWTCMYKGQTIKTRRKRKKSVVRMCLSFKAALSNHSLLARHA